MSASDDVVKAFHDMASISIDERGIYPLPMVAMLKGGAMEVSYLDLPPRDAMGTFVRKIVKREVDAIMFGLDRSTKPGQGTEFADVLTCALWGGGEWSEPGGWRGRIRVGVINYQHEPRIVRPIDWDNEFWNGKVIEEMGNLKAMRRSTGQEI
jgi:hypothetical protein